jgi:hypothetical protein
VFTVAAVLVAGCGGKEKEGPQSSPEKTFQTMVTAVSKNDWRASFRCLPPDKQEVAAAKVVLGGMVLRNDPVMGPGVKRLFKKHNAPLTVPEGVSKGSSKKELSHELTKKIKNKPAFLADMIKLRMQVTGKAPPTCKMSDSKLSQVKIKGNTATGIATLMHEVQKKGSALTFKKIKGRWFVDWPGMTDW